MNARRLALCASVLAAVLAVVKEQMALQATLALRLHWSAVHPPLNGVAGA
jgi:hypothetical protein